MRRLQILACIGTLGLLAWPAEQCRADKAPVADAQPMAPKGRTLRPRAALEKGVGLYQKGDFSAADDMFQQAEQNKHQLPKEDADRLEFYTRLNKDALLERYAAIKQLEQTEEAIRDGNLQEAESNLRVLKSNRYLSPREQAQMNRLNDVLRKDKPKSKGWFNWFAGAPNQAPAPVKKDSATLLTEARKAFEQGELATAERLAKEADQGGFRWVFPFQDTPAKVLKDVHAARLKTGNAVAQKPAERTKLVDISDPKRVASREILQQAREAMAAGEYEKARQLVKKAEDLKTYIPWHYEHNPEKIRKEIAMAEAAAKLTVEQASVPMKDAPLTPAEAKDLARQARRFLDAGKLDEAETLANRVRLVPGVKYNMLFDETPEKVLEGVAAAREAQNLKRVEELMALARQLMDQGELDQAEKLTYEAEALHANFGFFYRGDRPDKLRADIAARKRAERKPKLPPAPESRSEGSRQ